MMIVMTMLMLRVRVSTGLVKKTVKRKVKRLLMSIYKKIRIKQ